MFDPLLMPQHTVVDFWLSQPHSNNWPKAEHYNREIIQHINERIIKTDESRKHDTNSTSIVEIRSRRPSLSRRCASRLYKFISAPIKTRRFSEENIHRINQRMRKGLKKYTFYSGEQVVSNSEVATKWIPDSVNLLEKYQQNLSDANPKNLPQTGLHAVLRDSPVYCFPTTLRAFDDPLDMAFDEWRCSQLRYGELVHVRGKTSKLWYVESDYTEGWVDPTHLSGALSAPPRISCGTRDNAPQHPNDQALACEGGCKLEAIIGAPQTLIWQPNKDADSAAIGEKQFKPTGDILYQGTTLFLANETKNIANQAADDDVQRPTVIPTPHLSFTKVWIPNKTGIGWSTAYVKKSALSPTKFSRADILKRAFLILNEPYGWGGEGGLRDCSRFIMDLFRSFGIWLPRSSRKQAKTGLPAVDVHALSLTQKKKRIASLAKQGPLLLYFKGHIMLYLGTDKGEAFVIHQISAYRKPCPYDRDKDIAWRLNRTVISTLNLGEGSHRLSLIERITKVIIVRP